MAHGVAVLPPDSLVHEAVPPTDSVEAGASRGTPEGMVGGSRAMRDLRRMIEKIGPTDATVLITGETGTGKELVARELHRQSARRRHPFLGVNCGSIPETLLEGQLFGHVRGAFTGADRDKVGLLEVAGRGTLLLDEIGELPAALQPKILRALETREVLPVGATATVPVAVRVLAATHRDLVGMMKSQAFRPDLYYRLNVVELRLPALRERPEDIAELTEHLLDRHCARMGRVVPGIAPEALRLLERHAWPGNVRELANLLERVLILLEGERIEVGDLPRLVVEPAADPTDNLYEANREFERQHIRRVLGKWGGDKRRAAAALGIDVSSLYRKIRPGGFN